MDATAKLIAAVGALLGAIAWPVVILTLGLIFRVEIRLAFGKMPSLIDRVKKMKFAGIEAEIEQLTPVSKDYDGAITEQQRAVAAKIAVETGSYKEELALEMDRLCLEYDKIRRTMESGNDRTIAMTKIVIRMRAISSSIESRIEAYKGSASPGSRLAAAVVMQMEPMLCDMGWIIRRFEVEQPFVFFHAALALQSYSNVCWTIEQRDRLEAIVQKCLDTVRAFEGKADQPTIDVLESIVH